MDENNKTKLYVEKLAGLPEDVKTAFFSDAVTEVILSIGKTHGLAVDKIGELGDEIGLVMLGITQTGDFIKNLSDRLGVDKEKAKVIAEDVNQKVFQPIKISMRKVHGLPAESSSNIQAGKPEEKIPLKPLPSPATSAPVVSKIPSPPASPYIIPPKPPAIPPSSTSPYVIPMKQPAVPPAPVSSSVVIGGTKLDFAPLPEKKLPEKTSDFPGKTNVKEGEIAPIPAPKIPPPTGMPQIFAKKITPIDTLLDKIDAGEPARQLVGGSVIKPKSKIDSAALQLNPPSAGGPVSGIKTMFQDAKTFLTPKPATTVKPAENSSSIQAGKQEKYNAAPPNLPVTPPETTVINMPPKIESTAGLKRDNVKSEIENALGAKIKLDPPRLGEAGQHSTTDPYREPIE